MGTWTKKHRCAGDWDLWLVVYAIVALPGATDIYALARFALTGDACLGWSAMQQWLQSCLRLR
jgi:hypothetical protein